MEHQVKAIQSKFSDIIEDYCSSRDKESPDGQNYLSRLRSDCDLDLLQKCKP